MQTDLQALLIITGLVCGVYIIANLLRRRNKTHIFDQGSESELEDGDDRGMGSQQSDPLMDEIARSKKVIVDESVADVISLEMEEAEHYVESSFESPAQEATAFVALTVIAKKESTLFWRSFNECL